MRPALNLLVDRAAIQEQIYGRLGQATANFLNAPSRFASKNTRWELLALQIPGIFTGAFVTEQIFRVPGIGSLLISSILSNDTPVVMAITFVFSGLVVLFNLVADVMYGWLDPASRIADRWRHRAPPPERSRRE